MVTWYQEIPKVGACFAEFPCSRGAEFFKVIREDGEILVWVGVFHMILTPARRLAGRSTPI